MKPSTSSTPTHTVTERPSTHLQAPQLGTSLTPPNPDKSVSTSQSQSPRQLFLGRETSRLLGVKSHSVSGSSVKKGWKLMIDGQQGLNFYLQNKTVTSSWKVQDVDSTRGTVSMPIHQ